MTTPTTSIAYASLPEVKERLRITTDEWDTVLQSQLISASRKIDRDCGQRFWIDSVVSQRVYNPKERVVRSYDGDKVLTEPIASTTGFVFEIGAQGTYTTLSSSTYEFLPENALVQDEPITQILLPYGQLPYSYGRIRITALWGWPVVPEPIKEACLLLVARLFSRKESPNGIAGTNDFGLIRVGRVDPDYDSLVGNYFVHGIA